MLLSRESVSELFECSVVTVDTMIKKKELNTVNEDGEIKVNYNSLIKHFINKDCYEIKYFNTKKEYITDYLHNDTIKEIEDYNSVVMYKFSGYEFIRKNTFVVNPIVNFDKFELQPNKVLERGGFSLSEIDWITNKLYEVFTLDRLRLFSDITSNTQFYYGNISISDYSIIEFNLFIIVFHMDIYNGLKITINSIWLKSDIKLKKDFPLSIQIPLK